MKLRWEYLVGYFGLHRGHGLAVSLDHDLLLKLLVRQREADGPSGHRSNTQAGKQEVKLKTMAAQLESMRLALARATNGETSSGRSNRHGCPGRRWRRAMRRRRLSCRSSGSVISAGSRATLPGTAWSRPPLVRRGRGTSNEGAEGPSRPARERAQSRRWPTPAAPDASTEYVAHMTRSGARSRYDAARLRSCHMAGRRRSEKTGRGGDEVGSGVGDEGR